MVFEKSGEMEDRFSVYRGNFLEGTWSGCGYDMVDHEYTIVPREKNKRLIWVASASMETHR